MGNTSVEIFSFVLVILSIVNFILCSATDCWRQDAKDPYSSVGLSARCRGLWSECIYDNMANIWTCDIPISYLNQHPVSLVATRALVIIKGVSSIAATSLLILGMKCTTIIKKEGHHKEQFSKAAMILLLVGGISGAAAVFWFAIDTALKYSAEVSLAVPGITYELGYSYWLAVVASMCAFTSALLLIGVNCKINVRAEEKISNAYQRRHQDNAMTYL
uniref:Claudin n=1 Tax=Leptobrachium leishanense TaxID=445787 RepID=A0A8C5MSS4_9ANUR